MFSYSWLVCILGKKPHDLVKSLEDFVKDLLHFLQHGISQSRLHYEIEVDSFVCDTRARAYIKNVEMHSGYCRCDISLCSHSSRRLICRWLDETFAQQTDDEHHKGDMSLKGLPFGLVLTMCICIWCALVYCTDFWPLGHMVHDIKIDNLLSAKMQIRRLWWYYTTSLE
jgi:hypothetical protein